MPGRATLDAYSHPSRSIDQSPTKRGTRTPQERKRPSSYRGTQNGLLSIAARAVKWGLCPIIHLTFHARPSGCKFRFALASSPNLVHLPANVGLSGAPSLVLISSCLSFDAHSSMAHQGGPGTGSLGGPPSGHVRLFLHLFSKARAHIKSAICSPRAQARFEAERASVQQGSRGWSGSQAIKHEPCCACHVRHSY